MEVTLAVELAGKAKRGDLSSFEELCRLKQRDILFTARTMLGDEADAEDAAQETMIRMFHGIGKLKAPEAIHVWVQKIVRHSCIEILRRRKRTYSEQDIDDEEVVVIEENKEFLPEKYAEDAALSDRLYEIICALPEKKREAILMYYYHDMNYKEIAAVTGTTVQTVSTNLMKAKKMIKDKLEKNNESNDFLAGAASTTVLGRVLNEQATKRIADEQLASFEARWSSSFKTMKFGAKALSNITTGVVSVVAVAAVSAGIYFLTDPGTQGKAVSDLNTQTVVTVGADKRSIEFVSDDCECGHINPQAALIANGEPGDSPAEWEIISTDGELIYKGDAEGANAEISRLSGAKEDGRYELICTLTDEEGTIITLRRGFTVGFYYGDS